MQRGKILSNGKMVIPYNVGVTSINPISELPSKQNDDNVEWNITIVGRTDNRVEDIISDVNSFHTGLIIDPPKGYHAEIIQHPRLHMTGYNLIGTPIILPGNTEELILNLYKFKETTDLDLPYTAACIILRESIYAGLIPQNVKKQQKEHYEETPVFISPKVSKLPNSKRGGHMF